MVTLYNHTRTCSLALYCLCFISKNTTFKRCNNEKKRYDVQCQDTAMFTALINIEQTLVPQQIWAKLHGIKCKYRPKPSLNGFRRFMGEQRRGGWLGGVDRAGEAKRFRVIHFFFNVILALHFKFQRCGIATRKIHILIHEKYKLKSLDHTL